MRSIRTSHTWHTAYTIRRGPWASRRVDASYPVKGVWGGRAGPGLTQSDSFWPPTSTFAYKPLAGINGRPPRYNCYEQI